MSYDNKLRGALFKNDRKVQQNHPDYRGSIEDDNGREFWVSAWIKTPRSGGDNFLSLALTPKDERPATGGAGGDFLGASSGPRQASKPQPSKNAEGNQFDNFDDDIPF